MENRKKQGTLFLPFNLGSGNRGCEGIIEGIFAILGEEFHYKLLDIDEKEKRRDILWGINQFAEIYVKSDLDEFELIPKYVHKILRRMGFGKKFYKILPYLHFVKSATDKDIILFTGGDLFCYDAMAELNSNLHRAIKKRNLKTILYGCSISKEFLYDSVVNQLKNFDLIVCRESISIENLRESGITKNVLYCPDPAFVLEPRKCSLMKCFDKKVIGINLSNLVGFNYTMDSMYAKNIEKLIKYIIQNTEYYILLIPHVVWKDQDDREICCYFNKKFSATKRISILDINGLSYTQIRYVISNCSMFIGARTHSVISAYSTSVPTLALGYSVKSRGIARDLGIEEKFVLDCKHLTEENEMTDRFKILLEKKEVLHKHLLDRLPEYKKHSFDGNLFIKQISNR